MGWEKWSKDISARKIRFFPRRNLVEDRSNSDISYDRITHLSRPNFTFYSRYIDIRDGTAILQYSHVSAVLFVSFPNSFVQIFESGAQITMNAAELKARSSVHLCYSRSCQIGSINIFLFTIAPWNCQTKRLGPTSMQDETEKPIFSR